MEEYGLQTLGLHAGYTPGNGEPRVLPIYQSTTFTYDSTEHVGKLFDLSASGHMYSRLSNPTVDAVEKKIAALEGGVAALCTSSGQAATLLSLLNILKAGDHFISSTNIYGGTVNLFAVTFKKLGIECSFVSGDSSAEQLKAAFRPNTKAVFAETIANPALSILDIEEWAKTAHEMGVPLVIDNTLATPALCRPFEHGADIIVHSTTKYMDGHAVTVGGVIVDSGKFDWKNGKFPDLTEPDPSYHGLSYTEKFGNMAYIVKARVQLMRDFGVYPPALAAFILNLGLETLTLRMKAHSDNALAVAKLLESSDKIEKVSYPGLAASPYHQKQLKYMPNGSSGVISFDIKGGKSAAVRFIDSLKLVSNEVHVADIRSCILHPATSTHRQLTPEQLVAAGISEGTIRLSVGIENVEDILADVKQALANVVL
ncbi:aminotransferase class I/II-fold pyridoxal phosphate-dependent enzyme [Clostridiales bacterium COT073_COT-073]|nr:aminotransferase class I/II-fold pyridoxal phosphate-dependent enzyme [Clostridiales bacterium COT073_COT-073]